MFARRQLGMTSGNRDWARDSKRPYRLVSNYCFSSLGCREFEMKPEVCGGFFRPLSRTELFIGSADKSC